MVTPRVGHRLLQPFGMLERKAWRDLWRLRGPVAAIALVVACGIASFVGMRSMVPHLSEAQRRYYATARFADAWVHVTRAPLATAASLARIPGVAAVETRVSGDVLLEVPGLAEPATGHVVGLPVHRQPALDRLTIRAGRTLIAGRPDEIVLSEGFATANHLQPGDSLGVLLNGRWRQLHVVGTAWSPEFILEMRAGDLFPDAKRYGILWMDETVAAPALGLSGAWNDAALALAPNASEPAVIAAIDAQLAVYGSLGAYGRSLQASHRFLSDEIRQARTFAAVAPVILLGFATFLVSIVLSRLVASQREQIGMLKAFGISAWALARHYTMIALGPTLLGAALGIGLGLWLAVELAALYAMYYRMPGGPFHPNGGVLALAVVITVLAATVGALGAVRRVVRLPAAEAMRPPVPTRYRVGWIDRLPGERQWPVVVRLVLRTLARRPWRAALSLLGMAASVGVMMVGRFSFDAIDVLRDVQFTSAQREDIAVTFTRSRDARVLNDLARLPGVTRVEPLWSVPVRVAHGHRSRRIALIGVSADAELRPVVDRRGERVPLPGDGLLLSQSLAQLLDVRVGDTLNVSVLTGRRNESLVRVGALVDDLVGTNAWTSYEALAGLVGDAAVDGAVLRAEASRRPELYQYLVHAPAVASVAARATLLANFDKMMSDSFDVTLGTLGLLATVLAVSVVYNTARIALAERGRELASLRVLGFTRGEVARMLFGEQALLGLGAIPVGFVIGGLLCWFMASGLSSELFRLPLSLRLHTFLMATAVLLVAGVFSGIVVRRRLDTLDLVASLKVRE